MNENISIQERARATSAYCEKYLPGITSEYDDISTEARATFENALAFALDDEEPILATENITDRGNKSIEFALFTKTRVLYFKGNCEKGKQPAIRVIPRRTLEILTILNSPAVIDTRRSVNGHAHYALTYANGVEFELNANYARQDSHDAINNALVALYEDLES